MTHHYRNTTGPSYTAGLGWRMPGDGGREGGARDWDTAQRIWRVEAATQSEAISTFTLGSLLSGAGQAMYLQARSAAYVTANTWDVSLEYQGLMDLNVPQINELTAIIREREFTPGDIHGGSGTDYFQIGTYKVSTARLATLQVGGNVTFFSTQPLPLSMSGMSARIEGGSYATAQDNWDRIIRSTNNYQLLTYVLPNGRAVRSANSQFLVYGSPRLYKHTMTYINEDEINIT